MALVPELKMNESETVAKRESKAEQEHLRFHDDDDYRRARACLIKSTVMKSTSACSNRSSKATPMLETLQCV